MMKTTLMLLLVAALCACGRKEKSEPKRTELPPGYSILCNPEGTRYLSVMPGGSKLYKNEYYRNGYETKEEAIAAAWTQYEFISPPPDTVAWQECSDENETEIEIAVTDTIPTAGEGLSIADEFEETGSATIEIIRTDDSSLVFIETQNDSEILRWLTPQESQWLDSLRATKDK